MVQQRLDGYQYDGFSQPLTVVDDYGPLDGTTHAHHVACVDGHEYIVKRSDWASDNPHVEANEYIAAQLARVLGLPVLNWEVVSMDGRLCFAARWLARDVTREVTAAILGQCDNVLMLYRMVVFDAWVLNSDRHARNLLARRIRMDGRRLNRHNLYLIDHSEALLGAQRHVSDLRHYVNDDAVAYAPHSPTLVNSIVDKSELDSAIDSVSNLPDDAIQTCVQSVPHEWLSDGQKDAVQRLLISRRQVVRTAFHSEVSPFPALRGGGR